MSRISAKLCHRTPSTVATHALISFAASGYSSMASLTCLRVTTCNGQWYFTICEVNQNTIAGHKLKLLGKAIVATIRKANLVLGPDLYIAVRGRNSKSTSRHDRNKYSRQVLTVLALALSASR